MYTRCASEQARTLCFAGLAVVWIFRVPNPDNSGSAIPAWLVWCALGFILGLALDLAHYLVGAHQVKRVASRIEADLTAIGKSPKDESGALYDYPDEHPKLMEYMWLAKVTVASATWLLLLSYVGRAALSAGLPALG